MQHISYEKQLEDKKNALAKSVKFEDVKVFSDSEYGYRNRMDMIFNPRGIGFREKGNWKKVVDVDECVISNEKLNRYIKEVREHFRDVEVFDLFRQTGVFRYAVIRTPRNRSSISFVLNSDSTKLGGAIDKIKEFAEKTDADNVVVTYAPKKSDVSISDDFFVVKGDEFLEDEFLGKRFRFHVQGFFQNNSVMADKMHKYVRELLKRYDTKEHELLDLYGGVGTFGIINADLFKDVKTVESFQGCTDVANINIELNDARNVKAICLDAKNIKKLDFSEKLFVITDPPRSGMHPKTIEQLNALKPDVIVYVSCNIQQLAKDLPKLKEYYVKSAAVFDLFPQTIHSEGIVELIRKE